MNNRPSGSIPRKTTINDQPHMLAYINPQEAMMLKSMGGTGQPGPGGIPAFPPAGDYGYDGGAGQGSGQGEGPGNGFSNPANDPDASFDAFGDTYGTQEEAQAADVGAQVSAAQAGFDEGYSTKDAMNLFQQKIDTPVEQTGILGTLSKFSPMHMAGRALNKAQMQAAYDQLAGTSTPNQGFFAGIGKSLGITPEITSYEPVFDGAGNIVGSAGIGTGGNVVGYRGDRTVDVFGPEGIQDKVDAMNEAGQGGPGDRPDIFDDTIVNPDDPADPVDPDDPVENPFLIKNLDIIQPGTTVAGEVPSIYNQGGVVSLDPFKQLRNRM